MKYAAMVHIGNGLKYNFISRLEHITYVYDGTITIKKKLGIPFVPTRIQIFCEGSEEYIEEIKNLVRG